MEANKIASLKAGVDWVTWSCPRGDGESEVYDYGLAMLDAECLMGAELKPVNQRGYKGWRAGHVGVVSREDGTLITISSDAASSSVRRLRGMSGRPTRLDLQTTLSLHSPSPAFGSYMSRGGASRIPRRSRPRSGSTRFDWNGSFTAQRGSRTSLVMVRVYDKGVEGATHQPGELWRIEAETKKTAAEHHWACLSQCESIASYCYSASSSLLQRSGGWWPWPLTESVPTAQVPAAESRLRDEMAYLRKYVGPMLRRLRHAGKAELVWQELEQHLGVRWPEVRKHG